MRQILGKAGYIAFEVTAEDTERLGGAGICDNCNEYTPTGYLVPILNRYLCPSCYKGWDERAIMYPEDLHIEQKNALYYEAVIGKLEV